MTNFGTFATLFVKLNARYQAVQLSRADHVTQKNKADGQTFWDPGISESQPVMSWLTETDRDSFYDYLVW